MSRKLAIFDPIDQKALLGACESDTEYVPIWLMMNCGVHPTTLTTANRDMKFNGDFLEYRRCKNDNFRREKIPSVIKPKIENWLAHSRKLHRVSYNFLVHKIGDRVGHPEYSPMSLRHTFCINQLRLHKDKPDPIRLVAQKMGCQEFIVTQNYLDLEQWENME